MLTDGVEPRYELKIPRTHKVHPGSIPGSGTNRGPAPVRPAISIPSVDRNA